MTAVTKGATGKRDKFRKSVSRCGVSIYGPKHSQSTGALSFLFRGTICLYEFPLTHHLSPSCSFV